jgi:hypothetical protein
MEFLNSFLELKSNIWTSIKHGSLDLIYNTSNFLICYTQLYIIPNLAYMVIGLYVIFMLIYVNADNFIVNYRDLYLEDAMPNVFSDMNPSNTGIAPPTYYSENSASHTNAMRSLQNRGDSVLDKVIEQHFIYLANHRHTPTPGVTEASWQSSTANTQLTDTEQNEFMSRMMESARYTSRYHVGRKQEIVILLPSNNRSPEVRATLDVVDTLIRFRRL